MTETNFLKKTMQESTNSMSAQCEKNCCSAHDKLKRRQARKTRKQEREKIKWQKVCIIIAQRCSLINVSAKVREV